MKKAKLVLFLFMILMIGLYALMTDRASAIEQTANLQDPKFIDFVKWMRAKNYRENIVSKYAEDFMNPDAYPVMKIALIKNPAMIDNTKFSGINFVDLLPTDSNAVPDPADPAVVKELMKSTFGIDININYFSLPISYSEQFGPPTEGPLFILGKVENCSFYSNSKTNNYFNNILQKDFSKKYPAVNLKWPDMIRMAVSTVNGLPVVASGYAVYLSYIGSAKPDLVFGNNFDCAAHEWSHLLGLAHEYSLTFSGLGTYGTLGILNNKNPNNLALYFPKLSPLQAYRIEPAGGYDHPELILGEAYCNFLLTLDPSETPYTLSPNPKVKISTSFFKAAARGKVILQVDIQNTGNIPLALIPIKIISPLFGRGINLQTQYQTIDWLECGAVSTFSVPIAETVKQNLVSVHIDNTQCKIAEE